MSSARGSNVFRGSNLDIGMTKSNSSMGDVSGRRADASSQRGSNNDLSVGKSFYSSSHEITIHEAEQEGHLKSNVLEKCENVGSKDSVDHNNNDNPKTSANQSSIVVHGDVKEQIRRFENVNSETATEHHRISVSEQHENDQHNHQPNDQYSHRVLGRFNSLNEHNNHNQDVKKRTARSNTSPSRRVNPADVFIKNEEHIEMIRQVMDMPILALEKKEEKKILENVNEKISKNEIRDIEEKKAVEESKAIDHKVNEEKHVQNEKQSQLSTENNSSIQKVENNLSIEKVENNSSIEKVENNSSIEKVENNSSIEKVENNSLTEKQMIHQKANNLSCPSIQPDNPAIPFKSEEHVDSLIQQVLQQEIVMTAPSSKQEIHRESEVSLKGFLSGPVEVVSEEKRGSDVSLRSFLRNGPIKEQDPKQRESEVSMLGFLNGSTIQEVPEKRASDVSLKSFLKNGITTAIEQEKKEELKESQTKKSSTWLAKTVTRASTIGKSSEKISKIGKDEKSKNKEKLKTKVSNPDLTLSTSITELTNKEETSEKHLSKMDSKSKLSKSNPDLTVATIEESKGEGKNYSFLQTDPLFNSATNGVRKLHHVRSLSYGLVKEIASPVESPDIMLESPMFEKRKELAMLSVCIDSPTLENGKSIKVVPSFDPEKLVPVPTCLTGIDPSMQPTLDAMNEERKDLLDHLRHLFEEDSSKIALLSDQIKEITDFFDELNIDSSIFISAWECLSSTKTTVSLWYFETIFVAYEELFILLQQTPMFKIRDRNLLTSKSVMYDSSTNLASAANQYVYEFYSPEFFSNRTNPRNKTNKPPQDLPLDNDITYYRKHFIGSEHRTYIALDPKTQQTVYFVSIKLEKNGHLGDQEFRIVYRTKNDPDICLTISNSIIRAAKKKTTFSEAIVIANPLIQKFKLKRIYNEDSPSIETDILKVDELEFQKAFKFGILLVKDNQDTENMCISITLAATPEFDKFLSFIGTRFTLQGYQGAFTAGLDTKDNNAGTESVRATYQNCEIMFHVSTLLPYSETDEQQIQRKRHIGNDIGCIVFLQGKDATFDPSIVKSQFLHFYILVKQDTDSSKYRVSVVRHCNVPFFNPPIPDPPLLDGEELKNYILPKLINGESASLKAPKLSKPLKRARHLLFDDISARVLSEASKSLIGRADSGDLLADSRPLGKSKSMRTKSSNSIANK